MHRDANTCQHRRFESGNFVRVEDIVPVALLGEEKLTACGEFLVTGVTRNQRIEMGKQAVAFGAQDSTQPLRFFLARAKRAAHLNGDVRIRQVNRKVRNLRYDEQALLAAPKGSIEMLALE